MEKANQEIRAKLKQAGMPQWRLAIELKIADSTLVRWFHTELEGEKKVNVYEAINKLLEGR